MFFYLQDLFSLNEDTECDTHDLLKCRCDGQGETGASLGIPPPQTERSCQLGAVPSAQVHVY